VGDPAPGTDARYTSDRYFALVKEGVLGADDRVELLEGVVVSMSPQSPRHASAVSWAYDALRDATKGRAVVRMQLPLVLSPYSVPEPDVAIVPGVREDYVDRHPTTALLVVEASDTSLVQDRITKAAIYAAAVVPEYWILNVGDDRVEIFRSPDPARRRYVTMAVAARGTRLALVALGGVTVAVDDLMPAR
jgi:Uma2 family endonuclease